MYVHHSLPEYYDKMLETHFSEVTYYYYILITTTKQYLL